MFEAAIEAAVTMLDFVAGEYWQTKTGGFELSAYFSAQPLPVTLSDGHTRIVDLELVRAFSPQHQVALSLCAEAARSRRLQYAHELTADDLIRQIGLPARSAVAVPVVIDTASNSAAFGVMVFFKTNSDPPGPAAAESLDLLARCLATTLILRGNEVSHHPEVVFPLSEATEATPVWQRGVHALAKLVASTLRCGHCEMWYRTGPLLSSTSFGLIEILDSRGAHLSLHNSLAASLSAEAASSGQGVMWFSQTDVLARMSALGLPLLPQYPVPTAIAGVPIRLPIAVAGLNPAEQPEQPITTVALFAWYETYELCFTAPATEFLLEHGRILHAACILTAQVAEEARIEHMHTKAASLDWNSAAGGSTQQQQRVTDAPPPPWSYASDFHSHTQSYNPGMLGGDEASARVPPYGGYGESGVSRGGQGDTFGVASGTQADGDPSFSSDYRQRTKSVSKTLPGEAGGNRKRVTSLSEPKSDSHDSHLSDAFADEYNHDDTQRSGKKRARPRDTDDGMDKSHLWADDPRRRSIRKNPKAPPSPAPKPFRTTSTASALTKEPYGLPISEHMHMTEAGLPAVSDAALARVKGRSRAPKPKLAVALRRGKWPPEEEAFTNILIDCFRAGLLPLAEGTTLRTYLSGQLHCAPMRITKKYAKDASIGKQVYHRRIDLPANVWQQLSSNSVQRVMKAREAFFNAVLLRTHVDLSIVCPDPFPADGVVRDALGYRDGELFDDDQDSADGQIDGEADSEREEDTGHYAGGMKASAASNGVGYTAAYPRASDVTNIRLHDAALGGSKASSPSGPPMPGQHMHQPSFTSSPSLHVAVVPDAPNAEYSASWAATW